MSYGESNHSTPQAGAIADAEEEKVVCEIPVYLTKELSKQLLLLQFPQRPASVSLDESKLVEVKIKPEQPKLQVTLGINPQGPYYDDPHGEELAERAEGLGFDQDVYISDERRRIDKLILESSKPLKSSKRYAAAIIKDGAVHLTPLSSVLQMKPVLSYLNDADEAKAKANRPGTAAVGGAEDKAEEEATKVTVKFKRNAVLDNASKPITTKSSVAARKKDEEEPWINLKYESEDKEVYEKLCTKNKDNGEPMFVLTQKNYLEKLFPKYKEPVTDGSDKLEESKIGQKLNTIDMKEMNLDEQLKVLILNGKVMRYDRIKEFLNSRLQITPNDKTLLRILQSVAVLVQGCWVVKSDLVYPQECESNINGVSGRFMQEARDVVLSIFTEERFVERNRISPMLHLPEEEVLEILSGISQRVLKRGWEFLQPYDHSFIVRFPDVVRKQNKMWEVRNKRRSRAFK